MMADLSFKVWQCAIFCDHPAHRSPDPDTPDYMEVEFYRTKREWRALMRAGGWIFHRDGRVTCPECARPRGDA